MWKFVFIKIKKTACSSRGLEFWQRVHACTFFIVDHQIWRSIMYVKSIYKSGSLCLIRSKRLFVRLIVALIIDEMFTRESLSLTLESCVIGWEVFAVHTCVYFLYCLSSNMEVDDYVCWHWLPSSIGVNIYQCFIIQFLRAHYRIGFASKTFAGSVST